MACAGLLTVCLIRPPAPEPPRPPASAPAAGPAGHALFQDVSGERAGGAGAVALGVVSLAVSLQVSVVSLPVSPWTLSLTAPVSAALSLCFNLFLCPSLFFQVCWGPCRCLWVSTSASGSLPLSLSLSDPAVSVSVCLPYLYLSAFVSHSVPHSFSLYLSLSLVQCHCPSCPPTRNNPMYVSGRGAGGGPSTLDHRSSHSAPRWQPGSRLTQAGGPGRGSSPLTPDLVLTQSPLDPTQGSHSWSGLPTVTLCGLYTLS